MMEFLTLLISTQIASNNMDILVHSKEKDNSFMKMPIVIIFRKRMQENWKKSYVF